MNTGRKKSIAALELNIAQIVEFGRASESGWSCFDTVTWDGTSEYAELANAETGYKHCVADWGKYRLKLLRAEPSMRGVRVFEYGLHGTKRFHAHLVADRWVSDELAERCREGTGIGFHRPKPVWDIPAKEKVITPDAPPKDALGLVGYISKEMRKSYYRQDGPIRKRWAILGKWDAIRSRDLRYEEKLYGIPAEGVVIPLPTWREIFGETVHALDCRTRFQWRNAVEVAIDREMQEMERWKSEGICEVRFEELYWLGDAVVLKKGWKHTYAELRAKLDASDKLSGVVTRKWGDAHETEYVEDLDMEGVPF